MTLKNVGNGLLYQTALIPKMRKVQLIPVASGQLIHTPASARAARIELRNQLIAGDIMTQPADHHPDPDQFPDYPGHQPEPKPAYDPRVTPREPPPPHTTPPTPSKPFNISTGTLIALAILAAGSVIGITMIATGAIGYIIATAGDSSSPPRTAALPQTAPIAPYRHNHRPPTRSSPTFPTTPGPPPPSSGPRCPASTKFAESCCLTEECYRNFSTWDPLRLAPFPAV